MDDIVEYLVKQGDNGQYIISREQLLRMRAGGLKELEAAILKFATTNPSYTIAIEQIIGGMLDGDYRISWRKNL